MLADMLTTLQTVLSKRCQFYHCDVINLLEITTGFTILLLTVHFNVLFIS